MPYDRLRHGSAIGLPGPGVEGRIRGAVSLRLWRLGEVSAVLIWGRRTCSACSADPMEPFVFLRWRYRLALGPRDIILYAATKDLLLGMVVESFRVPQADLPCAYRRRFPLDHRFAVQGAPSAGRHHPSRFHGRSAPTSSAAYRALAQPLLLGPRRPLEARALPLGRPLVAAVVASLIPIKGIEDFIVSWRFLSSHGKDILRYHIYGTGPMERSLRRTASELGPDCPVAFKGFIPFEELAEGIDILVQPSIVPEACGMSVVEAFCSAIPVIVTDLGGQSELAENGHCGILIPPRSPEALAGALERLASSPDEYHRLSRNGLAASAAHHPTSFDVASMR